MINVLKKWTPFPQRIRLNYLNDSSVFLFTRNLYKLKCLNLYSRLVKFKPDRLTGTELSRRRKRENRMITGIRGPEIMGVAHGR